MTHAEGISDHFLHETDREKENNQWVLLPKTMEATSTKWRCEEDCNRKGHPFTNETN